MAPSPANDASSTRFDRLLAIRRSSNPHNSHQCFAPRRHRTVAAGWRPRLVAFDALRQRGSLDLGLCHLQTDAGLAVAGRGEAMKVARYTAMLHVAFLKRGPGRARPDGRQGRPPKPTSERDFMRRSPDPEEGGLQPPSYWRLRFFRPERPQQFSCRRG